MGLLERVAGQGGVRRAVQGRELPAGIFDGAKKQGVSTIQARRRALLERRHGGERRETVQGARAISRAARLSITLRHLRGIVASAAITGSDHGKSGALPGISSSS